jgi:hypothetical protein
MDHLSFTYKLLNPSELFGFALFACDLCIWVLLVPGRLLPAL